MVAANETHQKPAAALAGGAVIGTLGGLIGLGGAEFRLPLLIGVFRFAALEAIISLPTMLVGFARYSRDQSFAVLRRNKAFLLLMATGSIVGTLIGAFLLGFTPGAVLYPLLALILAVSAIKVWRHA